MSARIQLFPQFTPYELPVKWGHTFTSVAKALAKAGSVSGHGGARVSRPVSGTLRPPQKVGLVVMGQRGAV